MLLARHRSNPKQRSRGRAQTVAGSNKYNCIYKIIKLQHYKKRNNYWLLKKMVKRYWRYTLPKKGISSIPSYYDNLSVKNYLKLHKLCPQRISKSYQSYFHCQKARVFSNAVIYAGACTGFGWDGVNFFHSCPHGAMLQTVAETALITHTCFSSCWAKLTSCQGCLCFLHCPSSQGTVGGLKAGGVHGWHSWHSSPRKYSQYSL